MSGCEGYNAIARVYDKLNAEIDYGKWADFFEKCFDKYLCEKPSLVLDLACGTGRMTRELSRRGYDMIGVDGSADMLSCAMEADREGILYLLQDMREFELYGTVAAVVSVCDTMNYITEPEDLKEVFRLVNNYLDPGGCFIFDLKTRKYYRSVLAENVFAENREDCSLIWENYYDEENSLNEYDLTIYAETSKGLYQRFEETHCQRAWGLDEIKDIINEAGMEFVTAYDAFTKNPVTEESERIYVIAREKYQENKLTKLKFRIGI